MKLLPDRLVNYRHKSGLKVVLLTDNNTSELYANLTVNYGSNDFEYTKNELEITHPPGIAHYLEHLIFTSKDGQDYFEIFQNSGASCNAYTTYNQTSYLFSCENQIDTNLTKLFEMVQNLYITEESIAAERDIISEELLMYSQMPFEKLRCYVMQNVAKSTNYSYDIGGTTDTIKDINIDNLTEAFNDFYHLNNYTLFVSGNITKIKLDEILDKLNYNQSYNTVEKKGYFEVNSLEDHSFEYEDKVTTNLNSVVLKLNLSNDTQLYIDLKVLLKSIFSEINPKYSDYLKKGLINESFHYNLNFAKGINYIEFTQLGDNDINFIIDELISSNCEDIYIARAYKAILAQELRKMNNSKNLIESISHMFYQSYNVVEYYQRLEKYNINTPKRITYNQRISTKLSPI